MLIARARFAPTQRRTHCNTDRYPNGFVCRNKNDRADRRANANPIFAMISIFRFTVHGYSTVTLLARLRGLSTSVPLATAT